MRSLIVALVLPFCACGTNPTPTNSGLAMSADSARFLQRALDGWVRTSRDFLRLDPEPLPWVVAFDPSCTWHLDAPRALGAAAPDVELTLEGRRVDVRGVAHAGDVTLPNGAEIPARGTAFASLADDGATPFFVVALPEVWRQNPAAARHPDLDELIAGVVSHEIVHTRQVALVAARVAELRRAMPELPTKVNDDMVQQRFEGDAAFVAAWERETDLFFRAADERDPARRADLVREGLEVARARRARFFAGPDAYFAPLEELFLDMEGVAVLASFRLTAESGDSITAARGRNSWSQDEGFALLALCDAMVPGWRERTLGAELASPFALLAAAVEVPW